MRRSVALSPNSASPSDRGHVEAGRADLPQQRERQAATSPGSGRVRRNLRRAAAPPASAIPPARYNAAPSIQARTPVHSAAVTATWQLATLPKRAAVLPRDGDRASALLGKTRAVENQHAAALRNHRAELSPDALGAPGRMRDEVLKRLIRARIGDALEHRAHRLAPTVAQQPEQIATKRAALRDVREADLERLEPLAQAVEPRRRVARQSRLGASSHLSLRLHQLARQVANTVIERLMDRLLPPQGNRRLAERGNQLHLKLMLLERIGSQQPEQQTLRAATQSGQCSFRALLQGRHGLEVRKHRLEGTDGRLVRCLVDLS